MPKKLKVSADTVKDYPLTVPGHIIKTHPGALIFCNGRRKYALNGIASAYGHKDLEPIWKDSEEIAGVKMDIGALIKIANRELK